MDDQLKKLVQSARDFHRPGHVCHFASRVLVPLWRFKPEVWATTSAGPQQLDAIFFGLLENGVTSRKDIAARLGVDEDEFVFTHLDELVCKGYVADEGGSYKLTAEGGDFASGKTQEERLEKIQFPFVWGDMSKQVEPESAVAGKGTTGHKLKHGPYPPDDDLISVLAKQFNEDAESRERGLVFYDADYPTAARRFHYDKIYAEYTALFYAPQESGGDLVVDLRVYDKDDDLHFRLCEDLSRNANEDEHWHKQFADIYDKQAAASGGNSGGGNKR